MILLEHENRCVQEALTQRVESFKATQKAETIEISVADFDGVLFRLTNKDSRTKILMSAKMKCYEVCSKHGADAAIDAVFPGLRTETESGFDISLLIDLENLPADTDAMVQNLSKLKTIILSAPFISMIEGMEAGKAPPMKPLEIPYRDDESIYLKPEGDRLMVFFSVKFRDPDDSVFAKVFLQEFADARRSIRSAPTVTYNAKEAPAELKGLNVTEGENIGFVSFVLFSAHIDKKNRHKSVELIMTFRDYLHYHIKCSKAYMHTRMRSRVESLLLILNRARPEPFAGKVKKTMGGKTFKRD